MFDLLNLPLHIVSKGTFLRENSKQIIIDVIESLNLILVFSLLNNVHYIYRISEYISEVTNLSKRYAKPFCNYKKIKNFIKGLSNGEQLLECNWNAIERAAASVGADSAADQPCECGQHWHATTRQLPLDEHDPVEETLVRVAHHLHIQLLQQAQSQLANGAKLQQSAAAAEYCLVHNNSHCHHSHQFEWRGHHTGDHACDSASALFPAKL